MTDKQVRSNYKITLDTFALLPAFDIDYQTRAITSEGVINIAHPPLSIIKENCLRYGSSYNGRREAVLYHLNYIQRTPIPIHPSLGIIAFPTKSIKHADCIWLFLHAIHDIRKVDQKVYIEFINGQQLNLNESIHIIKKNFDRAENVMGLFQSLLYCNVFLKKH